MFYLVDKSEKIIFGWSPKCGSTHIKKIYWYYQGLPDKELNTPDDIQELPIDIENYITICIVRDPFARLISGFLDKYNPEINDCQITFAEFINDLVSHKKMDSYYFCMQGIEYFNYADIFDCKKQNEWRIKNSKELYIYKSNKINYAKIEELYQQNIPIDLLNWRIKNKPIRKLRLYKDVYNMDISKYYKYSVDIENFYDMDIKEKIIDFYKSDFYLYLRCK